MVTDMVLRILIALQDAATPARDEDGQTLAEYSLIMTTIAIAVVVTSVVVFRTALADAWNSAADCLNALAPC